MTDPSAAEFYRFVQEAKEQRVRADALAVALAQLKSACLEDIGGRHEEIQCALCLRYWPIPGLPRHDATCVLAANQPATVGAELLAAADAMCERARQAWEREHSESCWCDRSRIEADVCVFPEPQFVQAYRRARAGLQAAGPGRESEQR